MVVRVVGWTVYAGLEHRLSEFVDAARMAIVIEKGRTSWEKAIVGETGRRWDIG